MDVSIHFWVVYRQQLLFKSNAVVLHFTLRWIFHTTGIKKYNKNVFSSCKFSLANFFKHAPVRMKLQFLHNIGYPAENRRSGTTVTTTRPSSERTCQSYSDGKFRSRQRLLLKLKLPEARASSRIEIFGATFYLCLMEWIYLL